MDSTTNLVTTSCFLAGQAVVVVVSEETEMLDMGLGQGALPRKLLDMEHYKDNKQELAEDSNSCPMHICNFKVLLSLHYTKGGACAL
jgi:hypothetical protein